MLFQFLTFFFALSLPALANAGSDESNEFWKHCSLCGLYDNHRLQVQCDLIHFVNPSLATVMVTVTVHPTPKPPVTTSTSTTKEQSMLSFWPTYSYNERFAKPTDQPELNEDDDLDEPEVEERDWRDERVDRISSELDLDLCLANINGTLVQWPGGNFSRTCRSCNADWSKSAKIGCFCDVAGDTMNWSEIELDTLANNTDGYITCFGGHRSVAHECGKA